MPYGTFQNMSKEMRERKEEDTSSVTDWVGVFASGQTLLARCRAEIRRGLRIQVTPEQEPEETESMLEEEQIGAERSGSASQALIQRCLFNKNDTMTPSFRMLPLFSGGYPEGWRSTQFEDLSEVRAGAIIRRKAGVCTP